VPELLQIQPSLLQTIARSAKVLGEEDRYLDSVAAAMLERCERRPNERYTFLTDDEEAFFARDDLASYPSVLVRRGVRLVAQALGAAPELDQVNLVLDHLQRGQHASVSFSGAHVTAELGSKLVHFSTHQSLPSFRKTLESGQMTDPDRRWYLSATKPDTTEPILERKSFVVRVDGERVCGTLYAAVGIRGLKYQVLGMSGHRSISDILAELHLSKRAKGRVPIVCDMVGPLWVPGGPIADRVKITQATSSVIELEFGPLSDDH
jgi:tRNA(Ile)-lysidine synthase